MIGLYLIYYYPFQRYLAENNFKKYIEIQGTDISNIQEKTIIKDYKQNGYYIDVVFKDDPDFIYSYKFSVDEFKNLLSYKSISCNIYTKQNESIELTDDINNIKYPPVDY